MDFSTLFLENLLGGSSLSPSSCTFISATGSNAIGSYLAIADNDRLKTLGSLGTSLGTSLASNGESAYEKTMQELELTQAYIESLSQEELADLIARLETKEYELTLTEEEYSLKHTKKI